MGIKNCILHVHGFETPFTSIHAGCQFLLGKSLMPRVVE